MTSLGGAGTWVHVAAHGDTEAGRLGYSGLWLHGPDNGQPVFVSAFDVIERGASADLVVLNACRLAADAAARRANIGFAASVLRSGARNVVAAAWPISDGASAIWVPRFYATLSQDPDGNVGEALRSAQLALAQSRAYRHPYFWASLVHLGHVDASRAAEPGT